jgi:hypothetical protein
MTLREWMDEHLPWWLLGVIDWPRYRLFRRCWAEHCPVSGRLNILHTPRRLHRCEGTPMAISLTERGWLTVEGIDPDSVVPVSMHEDSA